MPSFGYEEECSASVGVGGWNSCSNRNCSCNECTSLSSSSSSYVENNYTVSKPPSTINLNRLNLEQIHTTKKAILFKVNSEKLPNKNIIEVNIWIPKYCLKSDYELYENSIDILKFKMIYKPEFTYFVADNPEQYRGMTAKKIYESLSETIKDITDIGFSKTQIYVTTQKTKTSEKYFFEYVKKYHSYY